MLRKILKPPRTLKMKLPNRWGISKRDLSILIGNTLDHFDTALYSLMAPIIAPLFFPSHDPISQLILVYSILATSLFTRPIGSILFGMIARKYDPALGLCYSLIGVSLSTVLIGITPSHTDIGFFAPLSLILTRILAGVCASGENTIAKLYIMEGKNRQEALKVSHLYESSTVLGSILASIAATFAFIYPDTWRFFFLFGGITGFFGYFLRRFSIYKKEAKNRNLFEHYQISTFKLLWNNRVNVIRVALTSSLSQITYVIPFVFMNSFIPRISSISETAMVALNSMLLVFDMMLIPVMGCILSKYNAVRVMKVASIVLAITIIPLFEALPGSSFVFTTFVRVWIVFWGIVFLCPLNLWAKQLFGERDQYFLIGIANSLGSAIVGRLTVPICLWLLHKCNTPLPVAIYIIIVAIGAGYAVRKASFSSFM